MTFEPDAVVQIEQRIALLEHLLGTPEGWSESISVSLPRGVSTPYGWLNNTSPSHIFCFDQIVADFFPEKRREWSSSKLRANVLAAKGNRMDVFPTTDIVVGWLRKPSIWENSYVSGSTVFIKDVGSLNQFDNVGSWSSICKAVATSESPMPRHALNEFKDLRFSVLRGAAGVEWHDFIDAARVTNYDQAVPMALISPTLYANLMYKTMRDMPSDIGNKFLWMSAISLITENVDFYREDSGKLLGYINFLHSKKLTPENLIHWYRMDISLEQMIHFSENDVDENIISSLLGNSPEYS